MDVLQVMAEPRRREIVRLIWSQELSVSAIAEQLGITIAATSQHLAKLRDAELVRVRTDGKRRLHQAEPGALKRMAPLLEAMWAADLDDLARVAEAEHRRGQH